MDDLKFFGSLILGIAAIMVCIAVGIQYNASNACKTYRSLSGLSTSFDWSTGCLVKTQDGRWVQLDAITGNSADLTVRGQ